MHPGLDREAGHVVVEVVRNRAHHRVALAHRAEDGGMVAHVERGGQEPRTRERGQKLRQVAGVAVSQANLFDVAVLKQVVRAGRTLQAGAQHEHSHLRGRLRLTRGWSGQKANATLPLDDQRSPLGVEGPTPISQQPRHLGGRRDPDARAQHGKSSRPDRASAADRPEHPLAREPSARSVRVPSSESAVGANRPSAARPISPCVPGGRRRHGHRLVEHRETPPPMLRLSATASRSASLPAVESTPAAKTRGRRSPVYDRARDDDPLRLRTQRQRRSRRHSRAPR